jgi:hypothetical protein
MDPETKKLLEETLALSKENNKILHALHRSLRLQRIMTILYWVFIICSAVGAFWLIQPYIDAISGSSGGNSQSGSDLLKSYQDLLK